MTDGKLGIIIDVLYGHLESIYSVQTKTDRGDILKKLIICWIVLVMNVFILIACSYEERSRMHPFETKEWGELFPFDDGKWLAYDITDRPAGRRGIPIGWDGLVGYKDAEGNVIVEPQYLYGHRFSEGLAFVRGIEGREYRTGFIDLTGNLAIPLPTIISGGAFSEGFAIIIEREWDRTNEVVFITTPGPFIFIDRTGQNVFGKEFASAHRFIEGFARVVLLDGREIFINTTGQNAFDMEFSMLKDFDNGYARVRLLDGTWTRIDRYGNIVGFGD